MLRPRLAFRDLLSEAVAGLFARPGRTILTVAGTVLGIAALVATLSLSKTAGNQIVGRFDALAATQIIAEPARAGVLGSASTARLPWDVEDRLLRLNGVTAAGAYADVDVKGATVRSVPVDDGSGRSAFQMQVVAATPGLLGALRGELAEGRWLDPAYANMRVVVLGAAAAQRLGIARTDNQSAIFIGEEIYTVIGIVGSLERETALLNAVILPAGTAGDLFGTASPSRVVVETAIGAASLIARQLPQALSPNDPAQVTVSAPPEPRRVRQDVESDVDSLFLVLGLVSLVVGAIGIANVTLVSVLERVGEIGLRRALGATRTHIAGQFLLESITMGFAGGIVGASAGTIIITAVSFANRWTPVLDPWIPFAAPGLGALVGLIAGVYPALRAAALEPVEALRAGT